MIGACVATPIKVLWNVEEQKFNGDNRRLSNYMRVFGFYVRWVEDIKTKYKIVIERVDLIKPEGDSIQVFNSIIKSAEFCMVVLLCSLGFRLRLRLYLF